MRLVPRREPRASADERRTDPSGRGRGRGPLHQHVSQVRYTVQGTLRHGVGSGEPGQVPAGVCGYLVGLDGRRARPGRVVADGELRGSSGTVDPEANVGADEGLALVRAADWVFSGPGSPTYALDTWLPGPVGAALRDRVRERRGVTLLASAAAATAGVVAVPVYESYKVEAPPFWADGLDLLSELGLCVAVI